MTAGRPGREVETARHWALAGPAHAGEAWRSAVARRRERRALNAHETRVELLLSAVAAQADDTTATWIDRYETLLDLVDGYRWTNDWSRLVPTVVEAIGLADQAGDLVRLARAATAPTVGAIGRSGPSGPLRSAVVDALQRCLEQLPPDDGPERCRVLLSLANEQFEDTSPAEREALVEEAQAMARRLDDWSLRLDADLVGFAATWRPATTERRLAWAEEALALATTLGDEQSQVVAATMRAVALGELGRLAAMWDAVRIAADAAERLHIPFGLLVLESLTLPWAAMAGDTGRTAEQLARITALQERMALHESDDAVFAAQLAVLFWEGARPLEAPSRGTGRGDGRRAGRRRRPAGAAREHRRGLLLRRGDIDAARRCWPTTPYGPTGRPRATVNWALAAEVALHVGDRALAADVRERLAPYADGWRPGVQLRGRPCGRVPRPVGGHARGPRGRRRARGARPSARRGVAAAAGDDLVRGAASALRLLTAACVLESLRALAVQRRATTTARRGAMRSRTASSSSGRTSCASSASSRWPAVESKASSLTPRPLCATPRSRPA